MNARFTTRGIFRFLGASLNRLADRLRGVSERVVGDDQKLAAMLSAMGEGVVALDTSDGILFCNPAAGRILGLDPRGIAGRPLAEVSRVARVLETVADARRGVPRSGIEVTLFGDRGERSVVLSACTYPTSSGTGVILVLRDSTEERRLASIRKDFVANASHELKTPLTAVQGYVDTLLEGAAEDPAVRERFLKKISDNVEQLSSLVEDLLTLSEIEVRSSIGVFREVHLRSVIDQCAEHYVVIAQQKNLLLDVQCSDDAPVVWAKEEWVFTILNNLLDNAMKYTEARGRVTLRLRTESGDAVLEVSDTGIGIPEHELPRVFERFYRVDKARSRRVGGTGLGLSIVKNLLQELRGSVEVSSVVGKGTTFTVKLPRLGTPKHS